MKKAFNSVLSFLLIVSMCLSICMPIAVFAETTDETMKENEVVETENLDETINLSTSTAPEGYVAQNSYIDKDDGVKLFSEKETPRVLLVEDVLPWDSNANQVVLNQLTEYDKVTTSEFLTVDLSKYGVIVFANDQPFNTYENYKAFKEYMELFASIGGVIVFGACDAGWSNGNLVEKLPGDISKKTHYVYYNYIVDYTHPIVTASLTDLIALEDSDLYNNYCSHVSFDEESLPAGTKIILREKDTDRPTLVEYPLGKGRVIASGLTWEHCYRLQHGRFARKAMDDMFKYAIRVSSIDVNDVHILKDYYINKNAHHIIVMDDNQNLIQGAKITIDSEDFYTDENGMVNYTKNYNSVKTVTVTADNYKKTQAKYIIKHNEVHYIFMSNDNNDGKPYITIANNSSNYQDLRYVIMRYKQNSGTTLPVEIRGEWGTHPQGKYVLYQEGVLGGVRGKTLTKTENSFSFAPGKVFDPNLPIKIKMVSSDGTESDPIATQIYVDEAINMSQAAGYNGNIEGIKNFNVIPDTKTEVKNENFGKMFPKDFKIEGATLPVEVSSTEDINTGVMTYKLVIGAISYEKKKGLLNEETEDGEWSNFIKDFKETVSDRVPEDKRKTKRNEFLRKWTDGKKNGTKWKSDFKIEGNGAGYAEVKIDKDGNVISSEGGFVINIGGKGSIGKTFPTAIGPVYFEASLGAEIETGIPVLKFTSEKGLDFGDGISFEVVLPSITLGGGYGVRKVATIGIEGNGKYKMKLLPKADKSGDIEASASISVKVMYLINFNWTFAKTKINLWSLNNGLDDEWQLYGGDMEIASRLYNSSTSDWNGKNNSIALMSMFETQQDDGLWVLQNSILPDSIPQIENVGNDKVMLFQYDDANIETGNHIKLMYSYFDNGEWSDPLPVIESETSDYYFDTLVDGDELYIVWQKSGNALSETDAEALMNKALEGSEICFAKWDKDQNIFTNHEFITDNNCLDMMPKLVANNNKTSIIWVQNQDNNIVSETENIICKVDLENNTFSSVSELGRINNSISEIDATYVNDAIHIMYLTDDENAEGNIYSLNNNVVNKLSALSISAENLLTDNSDYYWYSENCIYKYNSVSEQIEMFNISEPATNMKKASNGDKSAFVWTSNIEGTSYIKASIINDDVSEPITLYSTNEGLIKYFDVTLNNDNSWSLVLNIEDNNDVTSIGYIDIAPINDLSLEYAYADETDKVNGIQPVEYCIKNNGDSKINSFNMVISDKNGVEYINKNISCSIQAGAEQEFTESLNVENLNEVTNFSILVSVDGETNTEDNSEEFLLGCPDVSLSISQYKINNKLLITSKVSNSSNTPANTAISIVEDSLDGITLDMKNIGLLDNETDYVYNYEINMDDVDFNENGVKYYYVKVDTLENDLNSYDNYYVIPVYKLELFDISDEELEEINIVNVTSVEVEPQNMSIELSDSEKHFVTAKVMPDNATNKEVKWHSDNTEIVRVTDDGEIIAVGIGTAVVKAETYDGGYTDEMSVTIYSEEQDLYSLTVGDISNGSITVTSGEYAVGTEISVSAQPNDGYKFKSWSSSNGGTFADVNASSTTFTMPANDTTITATFEKKSSAPTGGGGGGGTPSYKITVTQGENGTISPSSASVTKNGNKTFTIVANEGYEIEDVIVDGESVGAVTSYTFEKVTKAATITAKFKKIEETKVIWKNPFDDVKENDWFYEAVKFALEKGITSGVSQNKFAPNNKVTRGQFITMLCRAYGIKEMTGDNFVDCGDTWYSGYLAAAKQLGISKGVGDNKFAPEKEITREEMVTLIYNYLKLINEVDIDKEETSFKDNDSISDWAKAGVAFASSNGYVNGKGDNLFDPNGDATRAELAQIFFNIFK